MRPEHRKEYITANNLAKKGELEAAMWTLRGINVVALPGVPETVRGREAPYAVKPDKWYDDMHKAALKGVPNERLAHKKAWDDFDSRAQAGKAFGGQKGKLRAGIFVKSAVSSRKNFFFLGGELLPETAEVLYWDSPELWLGADGKPVTPPATTAVASPADTSSVLAPEIVPESVPTPAVTPERAPRVFSSGERIVRERQVFRLLEQSAKSLTVGFLADALGDSVTDQNHLRQIQDMLYRMKRKEKAGGVSFRGALTMDRTPGKSGLEHMQWTYKLAEKATVLVEPEPVILTPDTTIEFAPVSPSGEWVQEPERSAVEPEDEKLLSGAKKVREHINSLKAEKVKHEVAISEIDAEVNRLEYILKAISEY